MLLLTPLLTAAMLLPLSPAMGNAASPGSSAISIQRGAAVAIHQLHYRKLYEEKPFPDATLTHYANGVYRITSEGEDHFGVYVLQGAFSDETCTVRYISLPSPDWGDRTAFHQLTFVTDADARGFFIQDAVTDKGDTIAQQNGTFSWQGPDTPPDR